MSRSITTTAAAGAAGAAGGGSGTCCNRLRIWCSKFYKFLKYTIHIVIIFFDSESNSNEAALNLVLFLFYPALLWLLLEEKYRIPIGLCGANKYERKIEAISACKSLYLYFALLLRIYKLGVILLFHQKASYKQRRQSISSIDNNNNNNNTTTTTAKGEEATTKKTTSTSTTSKTEPSSTTRQYLPIRMRITTMFKCRAWMHLTHELGQIGMVVFLLLVCLPVLAFWTMFISILYSCYSLIKFLRTLWKESQQFDNYDYDYLNEDDDDDANNDHHYDEEEGTKNMLLLSRQQQIMTKNEEKEEKEKG